MSSPLSYWAWGRADRFPDAAARAALAEQFSMLASCPAPPLREPKRLEEIRLPAARLEVPGALERLASAAVEDRIRHTYGRSYPDLVQGFAGEFSAPPDWVAFPSREDEVEAVLDWAESARAVVVPFGGGTSVVGGVAPVVPPGFRGVVSLDLRRLNRVLEVDAVSRSARIQAGARGPDLEEQLAPHGLTLRHYPQSFEYSTLGPPPRWRTRATVVFADFASGVGAARDLAQSGLFPSNCRLLDSAEALVHGVSTDGSTVLLLGFESADHPLDAWMERALAITTGHGGRCPGGPSAADRTGEASDAWREAFFRAPYLQSALVSLGAIADTFETACTWDRFARLHETVVERVEECLRVTCGSGLVACRLTHVYPDGPAPYYTFLAPSRPGAQIEQWTEVKRAAAEAVTAAGGTITHHHAVGRVHRPWYDRERPESFGRALRAAKATLDPAGMLNPGVLMD